MQTTSDQLATSTSKLSQVQSQYDQLQVRLQKTERDEKHKDKSLAEVNAETAALKVRRRAWGAARVGVVERGW